MDQRIKYFILFACLIYLKIANGQLDKTTQMLVVLCILYTVYTLFKGARNTESFKGVAPAPTMCVSTATTSRATSMTACGANGPCTVDGDDVTCDCDTTNGFVARDGSEGPSVTGPNNYAGTCKCPAESNGTCGPLTTKCYEFDCREIGTGTDTTMANDPDKVFDDIDGTQSKSALQAACCLAPGSADPGGGGGGGNTITGMCAGNTGGTGDVTCVSPASLIANAASTPGTTTTDCCVKTGMCRGNTDPSENVTCASGSSARPSPNTRRGSNPQGNCCETNPTTGMCTGNTGGTGDFTCVSPTSLVENAATTQGSTAAVCCETTGMCAGNTNSGENVTCVSPAQLKSAAATTRGSTAADCCETTPTTGMCTGNTGGTGDVTCVSPASLIANAAATPGSTTTVCCEKTGMCIGNTNPSENVTCAAGSSARPSSNTIQRGSNAQGSCCVTTPTTGKCTGNTDRTAEPDVVCTTTGEVLKPGAGTINKGTSGQEQMNCCKEPDPCTLPDGGGVGDYNTVANLVDDIFAPGGGPKTSVCKDDLSTANTWVPQYFLKKTGPLTTTCPATGGKLQITTECFELDYGKLLPIGLLVLGLGLVVVLIVKRAKLFGKGRVSVGADAQPSVPITPGASALRQSGSPGMPSAN